MIRLTLAAALLTTACSGTPPGNTNDDGAAPESSVSTTDTPRRSEAGSETAGAEPSPASVTVPERFRGLYAADRRACEEDYSYNPAFQNVTVKAHDISFFETGGPVTDVNVQGNSIAITLRETVGDGRFIRAIYLALNDDGTVRYRPERNGAVKTYVRCADE